MIRFNLCCRVTRRGCPPFGHVRGQPHGRGQQAVLPWQILRAGGRRASPGKTATSQRTSARFEPAPRPWYVLRSAQTGQAGYRGRSPVSPCAGGKRGRTPLQSSRIAVSAAPRAAPLAGRVEERLLTALAGRLLRAQPALHRVAHCSMVRKPQPCGRHAIWAGFAPSRPAREPPGG